MGGGGFGRGAEGRDGEGVPVEVAQGRAKAGDDGVGVRSGVGEDISGGEGIERRQVVGGVQAERVAGEVLQVGAVGGRWAWSEAYHDGWSAARLGVPGAGGHLGGDGW